MVLDCDFRGYIYPEMVKKRPVIVISPNHMMRPKLCTVVPFSLTPPQPIEPYHYEFVTNPIPGRPSPAWAKCDMAATVCYERLDRIWVQRGLYQTYQVGPVVTAELRKRAAISMGLTP